jgi:hypothetical protein
MDDKKNLQLSKLTTNTLRWTQAKWEKGVWLGRFLLLSHYMIRGQHLAEVIVSSSWLQISSQDKFSTNLQLIQ